MILIVVLLVVAYIVNNYIQDKNQNKAQESIRNSFTQLSMSLKKTQKEIEESLTASSQNIHLIASMNLIENYEDSEAYDNSLFNNEKKRVIDILKTNQLIDYLAIYDTTNRLVIMINNSDEPTSILFHAYKDLQRIYLSKASQEKSYKQTNLSSQTLSTMKELSTFTSQHSNTLETRYQTNNKILRVKSKIPIIRKRVNTTDEIVGYIVALKKYKESDLTNLILPNMSLSYSVEPKKEIVQSLKFSASGYTMPKLFSSQTFKQLLIQKQDNKFFARVEFPLEYTKLLIKVEAP